MKDSDMLKALGEHYGLAGPIWVELVEFPLDGDKRVCRWRLYTLNHTDFAYLPVEDDGYMSGYEAIRRAYKRIFHGIRR